MISFGNLVQRTFQSAILPALALVLLASSQVAAQRHALFSSQSPVGEIGRIQTARRPELRGVFQAVLIKVPQGAVVSVADQGGFSVNKGDVELVGLQVGETYRLRVTAIPNQDGDVYPTIELIDRMHPPAGKELRHPIPIDITADDLRMALSGKYVTRVVYVEDPRKALPVRDLPDDQRYLEVMAHEDPLHVAQQLGRPVAILRMGSLTPSEDGPSDGFLFGSALVERPALVPMQVPYVPSKLSPADLPAAEGQAKDAATPRAIEPDQPTTEPVSPDSAQAVAPEAEEDPAGDDDTNIFDEGATDNPFNEPGIDDQPADTDPPDEDDPFGDEI